MATLFIILAARTLTAARAEPRDESRFQRKPANNNNNIQTKF